MVPFHNLIEQYAELIDPVFVFFVCVEATVAMIAIGLVYFKNAKMKKITLLYFALPCIVAMIFSGVLMLATERAREESGTSAFFPLTNQIACTQTEVRTRKLCNGSEPRWCGYHEYCAFNPHTWTVQTSVIHRRSAATRQTNGCPAAEELDTSFLDTKQTFAETPGNRLRDEFIANGNIEDEMLFLKVTPALVRASIDVFVQQQGINTSLYDQLLQEVGNAFFARRTRSFIVMHRYAEPVFLYGEEPRIISEARGNGALVYMSPELATGLPNGKLGLLTFRDTTCSDDTAFQVSIGWSNETFSESMHYLASTSRFLLQKNSRKEALLGPLEQQASEALDRVHERKMAALAFQQRLNLEAEQERKQQLAAAEQAREEEREKEWRKFERFMSGSGGIVKTVVGNIVGSVAEMVVKTFFRG